MVLQHLNTSWSPNLVPRLSCEGGDTHAWKPKPQTSTLRLALSQSALPLIHWTEMWHNHLLDVLINWNSSFQVHYLTSGLYITCHIALNVADTLHWRWCRCKCCRHMRIGKFALITAWNTKILPPCWNYYNVHHSWIVHWYVSITLFSRVPVKDLQNASTRWTL